MTSKCQAWLGAPFVWTLAVPIVALGIYLATGEAFWSLSALVVVSVAATAIYVTLGRQSLTTAWRGGVLGMLAWLVATLVVSGGQPDDAALFSAPALLFAAAGFVAEILFLNDAARTTEAA